ncbi:sensory neuron membrane protein 2 [Galleria mellonella]|uniref:Sensory neuron membrane protein 2 n=1 Tax=Galleria mellonella TaxID=7137 RepID=A0A5C0E5E9_GALME|nr:sensory neuron membrane protein 2 [Galleria mellonella]QEI46779.1 sensory neuron membrane protein 2 [Galleria mellonella]
MLGKRSRLFFGISVGALIISIILAVWGFPKIIRSQIQKNIQLDNSSMMYEKWRVLPMPLKFKITVFNVTNTEEINNGKKPKLQEIGPFVYKEYRERTVLGYGDNDTIKYMLKKTFIFDAEESAPFSEDDMVTVINFSYMAALITINDMMPALVSTLNMGFQEMYSQYGLDDPFITVKARDLFFDGLFLNCRGNHSSLALICSQISTTSPPTMRPTEDGSGFYFSMFSHLNRTASGPYSMVRGIENVKELGHIVSYKEKTFMNNWGSDPYCGQLNGSDSSIYPPIDENNVPKRLYTFQPDICRSIYVDFMSKTNIFNMSAYYYELSESAFASKSANPDNKCYCKKNWSGNHDGCLLMGVMNLFPCQQAPAIASLPHFYLASEELLEFFDGGIKPDKEKHKSYIMLEPNTGAVLKGVQRLQFNVELRQMKIPQLMKVPTGLFPMLWIEESAEVPPSIQEELQQNLKLIGYANTARWVILALAIIAAVVSTIVVVRATLPGWSGRNSVFVLRPTNVNGIDLNKG